MKKILLISFCVLISNILGFSQWKGVPWENPLLQLKLDKKYDEGILQASKLIETNPNDSKIYTIRADFFKHTDKLENAIADMNKAISIEPENADYLIQRATYYYLSGNNNAVLNDIKSAVQLGHDKLRVLTQGTDVLFKSEQFPEIIKIADFYISRTDFSSYDNRKLIYFAYKIRGKAKFENKDYESAIEDSIKSIELLPITGNFKIDLGMQFEITFIQYEWIQQISLMNLKDDKKISDYYKRTVFTSQKKLKELDYFFRERNMIEQSIRKEYSTKATDESAFSSLVNFMIPYAYYFANKDQLEKGIEIIDRINQVQPHWLNQLKCAEFLKKFGKYQEAIEQLTEINANRSKPISIVLIERGDVYVLMKQYQKAIIDYETVIAHYPDNETSLRKKIIAVKLQMQERDN